MGSSPKPPDMAASRRHESGPGDGIPTDSATIDDEMRRLTASPQPWEDVEKPREPAVLPDRLATAPASPMAGLRPGQIDERLFAAMPTRLASGSRDKRPPLHVGPPQPARLTVIGGNDRGREFILEPRDYSVGRGTENDLILTDIAVSRRHIILRHDGTGHVVRDLGSGNGTVINGERVDGELILEDGDQIEIGNTLFRFETPANKPHVVGAVPPPPELPTPPSEPDWSDPSVAPPPAFTPGGTMMAAYPLPPVGSPPLAGPPPPAVAAPAYPAPTYPPVPGMPTPGMPTPGMPAPGMPAATIPPGYQPPNLPVGTAVVGSLDLAAARQRKLLIYVGAFLGFVGIVVLAAVIPRGPEPTGITSTEARPSTPTPPPRTPAVAPSLAPPALSATTTAPPEVPEPAEPPPLAEEPPPPPPPSRPAVATTSRPHRQSKPRPARVERPERPERPEPASDSTARNAGAAERQAAGFYKNREFSRASETLRLAAVRFPGSADRLNAMARDYDTVGFGIQRAAATAGNPPAAMTALQDALRADSRSGKQVHAPELRRELARVAPRAAIAHYSAGRYEQARSACDAATNYGAGADPSVAKVRSLLEAKAKELYTAALKADPTNQRLLLGRVIKMVPTDNVWYSKAYAALNKSSVKRPLDEDEE